MAWYFLQYIRNINFWQFRAKSRFRNLSNPRWFLDGNLSIVFGTSFGVINAIFERTDTFSIAFITSGWVCLAFGELLCIMSSISIERWKRFSDLSSDKLLLSMLDVFIEFWITFPVFESLALVYWISRNCFGLKLTCIWSWSCR